MDNQNTKSENTEIDLLELVKQLWSNRWFIIKVTGIALIIGLIVAISIPKEYTCIVKMAPEGAKTSITGNVSSLAAMAGINIGAGNDDGLNLNIYPDLVQSMPFINDLMNIPVKSAKHFSGGVLYNYVDKGLKSPWWNVVLASPFKLMAKIVGKEDSGLRKTDPYNLTQKEEDVYNCLKKRISLVIDKKTGIITTGVTLQDPLLTAVVADSIVSKLQGYVIDYRTGKAKNDLIFATKMLNDAKQKYYSAQHSYANYVDENRNIILESVRIEQERLKDELQLAYNVYSNLAQQVETARMKVQEQTPCVTIIEPARVPTRKSNTSKALIVIILGIIGSACGAVKIIYSNWNQIKIS